MWLNFRRRHYSYIAVIIHGLIFTHWQVLQKINPLATVKSDLCTLHMDQVLHVHLTMATLKMETRLQSNMGGSCHRRTRVQVREKQLSRSLCLGSSQRRNGGQSCTAEDFMNVLTVLVGALAVK